MLISHTVVMLLYKKLPRVYGNVVGLFETECHMNGILTKQYSNKSKLIPSDKEVHCTTSCYKKGHVMGGFHSKLPSGWRLVRRSLRSPLSTMSSRFLAFVSSCVTALSTKYDVENPMKRTLAFSHRIGYFFCTCSWRQNS